MHSLCSRFVYHMHCTFGAIGMPSIFNSNSISNCGSRERERTRARSSLKPSQKSGGTTVPPRQNPGKSAKTSAVIKSFPAFLTALIIAIFTLLLPACNEAEMTETEGFFIPGIPDRAGISLLKLRADRTTNKAFDLEAKADLTALLSITPPGLDRHWTWVVSHGM